MSDYGDESSIADHARNSTTIVEVSEPPSLEAERDTHAPAGPSVLANLLKGSPPQSMAQHHPPETEHEEDDGDRNQPEPRFHTDASSERTPLLSRVTSGGRRSYTEDLEGLKSRAKRPWISGLVEAGHKVEERMTHSVAVAVNLRRWDGKAIWHNTVVTPVSCLPAVAVGLLLNILDALSYGALNCYGALYNSLTDNRYDSFSSGKANLFTSRICRYLGFLCQHHRVTNHILIGQYL